MSDRVSVSITRQEKYRFVVDFGPAIDAMVADEPAPLGDTAGPSPSQLLAAAVANCLSASLVFAFNKFREDPGPMTATAVCEIGRNEKNRLRVLGIEVTLALGVVPADQGHLQRALAQFEEFCTVSQSVRAGVPIRVAVAGPDGAMLRPAQPIG